MMEPCPYVSGGGECKHLDCEHRLEHEHFHDLDYSPRGTVCEIPCSHGVVCVKKQ
jgi:hypothetical protein